MAERHKKAPPQRFRCRPVHVVATSVNGSDVRVKIFKPEQGVASQEQENLARC
jgi:hypothetical protein